MKYKTVSDKGVIARTLRITDGLLGSVTDMVLFTIFYGFEASMAGYGKSYKAVKPAHDDLERVNYKTIKRALKNLKQKGLINIIEEGSKLPGITEAGKRRLNSILPKYDAKRIWDKRIYLITYDIPVKRNNDRNKLRRYLKTVGCAALQESVWVTPYNPRGLIEEFVRKSGLETSLVVVSSMGKDGAIGEAGIDQMLESVYGLVEINEQYRHFIQWVNKEKPSRDLIISAYLSILKDDPQLPFELLPGDWEGGEAYGLYRSAVGGKKQQNSVNGLER